MSPSEYSFTVYYGDGTRLDVLRASGAGKARQIAVCVETRATANRIVELVRSEFPQAKLLVVPSIASTHVCWSAPASTIRSEKHSSRRCRPAAPRFFCSM